MTNPKPSPIRLSISTRLTLWYGTTLFLLLSVFTVFCYSSFHVSLHRDYDRHLTHEERELAQYVRLEDGQPKFAPLSELRSVAYQTDGTYGTYVRLFSAGGETLYTSPNWAGHQSLAVAIPGTAEQKTVSRTWEDKPARSRYAPLLDDDGSLAGWLEVTGFEWSLHQELRRLGRTLALGTVLSFLLSIGGGYWLARRALRPVAALTDGAKRIRATDLGSRLPTQFGVQDELSNLAETFNEMIERLESSFDRERRFSANAAHELQTPLTTLQNSIDVTLKRDRDVEKYKKTLRLALLDVGDMSRTVRGLLSLSQAEQVWAIPKDTINLSELTLDYVTKLKSRTNAEETTILSNVAIDVFVYADAALLREALDNLVENALKYSSGGRVVSIALSRHNNFSVLTVQDNGIGFSDDQMELIFHRFYRANASAVQAQTGSGLGLTIVNTIVQAFGGTVKANSSGPGKGSSFEIRLPLSRIDGNAIDGVS